jgi:magnesium transporter
VSETEVAQRAPQLGESLEGCTTFAVEFEFEPKQEQTVSVGRALEAIGEGRFCWIDIDVTEPGPARSGIARLGLVPDDELDAALAHQPATQLARYDDYLHLVVTGCRLSGLHFDLERVDILIRERCILTLHRGPAVFLDAVRRTYRSGFYQFARTPSFLLFEIWDHLIENYLSVQKQFEDRVALLQAELVKNVDDETFNKVSELGSDLLHFRKVLLPARGVLNELSTRRSMFVSEATQPFLANMMGTLERVLGDLNVDREILSESLNLHVSIVGHRTNATMKYLTIMSAVFLPLAFIVGFFGQNFDNFPGMRGWARSDALMWTMIIACLGTPIALVFWFRSKKWL